MASTLPGQAAAARAASPLRRSRGPRRATATSYPRSASSRPATKPSPPLFPGPARTMTRFPAGTRRWAAFATALARRLHQYDTRRPGRDREPICLAHFFRREQLNHLRSPRFKALTSLSAAEIGDEVLCKCPSASRELTDVVLVTMLLRLPSCRRFRTDPAGMESATRGSDWSSGAAPRFRGPLVK